MIISHINLLANDGLALLKRNDEEQSLMIGSVDSIEPKRQELEEMKRNLNEQLERKTHFFNLLKMYIEQLTLVRQELLSVRSDCAVVSFSRSIIGARVVKVCWRCIPLMSPMSKRLDISVNSNSSSLISRLLRSKNYNWQHRNHFGYDGFVSFLFFFTRTRVPV